MMEECIAYLDGEGAWHVVPHEKVIRCKDCYHFYDFEGKEQWCTLNGSPTETDAFCSWAKRKEE